MKENFILLLRKICPSKIQAYQQIEHKSKILLAVKFNRTYRRLSVLYELSSDHNIIYQNVISSIIKTVILPLI
jgi:hypothetical protein